MTAEPGDHDRERTYNQDSFQYGIEIATTHLRQELKQRTDELKLLRSILYGEKTMEEIKSDIINDYPASGTPETDELTPKDLQDKPMSPEELVQTVQENQKEIKRMKNFLEQHFNI